LFVFFFKKCRYLKFAKAKGWPTEVLSLTRNSEVAHVKGLREASLAVKDPRAYAVLKWESGVHRVGYKIYI
jgi:protein subunit release factor A